MSLWCLVIVGAVFGLSTLSFQPWSDAFNPVCRRTGSFPAGYSATLHLPRQGAERIVAEADGSMVPVVYFEGKASDRRKNRKVEYREVRLCATQASGTTQTIYRAGIGPPEDIGQI